MLIGYCRVSTTDQNLDLQTDQLKQGGCEKIFYDKISGANAKRPGIESLLDHIRSGDCVIVWKLDRLGRSMKDLLEIVHQIQEKGAGFRSITEQIDTTQPVGTLIFHIFGALAQFEKSLIKERVMAGINAARARGKPLGRRKGLSKEAENTAVLAANYYSKHKWSIYDICEKFDISKGTLYKYLRLQGVTLRMDGPKFGIIA